MPDGEPEQIIDLTTCLAIFKGYGRDKIHLYMTFNFSVWLWTVRNGPYTRYIVSTWLTCMLSYLKILHKLTKLWPGQGPSIWPWSLTSKCDLDLWGTGLNIECDTSSHNCGHLRYVIWKSVNQYESYDPDKKIRTVACTHKTPNSHRGDKVELTASGLNKKIHIETLITRNLPIPYFDWLTASWQ